MMDVWLVAKITLIFAGALVGVTMMRRRSAAVRALVLTSAFLMAMMLPTLSAFVPVLPVPVSDGSATPEGKVIQPPVEPSRVLELLIGSPRSNAAAIAPRASWSVATVLMLLWLAGVALALAPAGVAVWRAAGVRRRAVAWTDAEPMVRALGRTAALDRNVDIRVSSEIEVPMASGIISPIVLMPAAATQWSETHRRHAILHEIEHTRRRDVLVIAIARVACACYWFHPLVWIAWRRLRLEIERACDDAVVAKGEHVTYAEQLVDLARRMTGERSIPVAMANRSDLTARVAALLDPSQSRARVGATAIRFTVVLACALTLLIAPLRIVAAQGGAQPELQPRPAPIKGGGTVTGVIYDPTGAPVGGLLLIVDRNCFGPNGKECGYGTWTRTDRFGHYRVEGLPAGNFHIVSQIDFFPGVQFWIAMGETIERDITMTVEPVTAEFTVCATCAEVIVPDSLAKEFEADRKDALDHPVSAPRPAGGWEFYKPGRGEYPPTLREFAAEGSVVVEGTVGLDGALIAMKAEPAGTPVAAAALATLGAEIWEPGRVRGVAIEVPFRFLIRYTLKD